jgi:hypothetical protein
MGRPYENMSTREINNRIQWIESNGKRQFYLKLYDLLKLEIANRN